MQAQLSLKMQSWGVVVKKLNGEMLKTYFEGINRGVGTKTGFVIVDHAETARDWYEAGGSEHKKTFTDGSGDRSVEYPACEAARWR
jgi:hypothetical protein